MQIFKYYGTLCSVCVCVCVKRVSLFWKRPKIFKYSNTMVRCVDVYIYVMRDMYIRKEMDIFEK